MCPDGASPLSRRDEEVFGQMFRKGLQDWMYLSEGILPLLETAVKVLNGLGNRPDALLRGVLGAPRVLAQVFEDLLPLLLRLRLG